MDPGRKRREICRNRFGVAKIGDWAHMSRAGNIIFNLEPEGYPGIP